MATNLHATIRSTEMTEIVTLCSSSSHLFLYSGSPPSKTASPTGTSIVTGGIALSATMGTTGTDGTDAGTKLTLSGTPLSGTSAYTGTPGYYRVVIGATDDGAHTALQGVCNVTSAGTGNVTATAGSNTLTFASSQSSLAGSYIQVAGDPSAGSYLITNGSHHHLVHRHTLRRHDRHDHLDDDAGAGRAQLHQHDRFGRDRDDQRHDLDGG